MSITTTRLPVIRSNKVIFRVFFALLTAGLTLGVSALAAAASPRKSKKPVATASAAPQPLAERSVEEILAKYTFVGDFTEKDAERPISNEVFWRYPYVLPSIQFPINMAIEDPKTELPATRGEGRAVDHLNLGRVLFLEGNYADAKSTWLSARARYGNKYPFHRRNDYFIGYSFLNLAADAMKNKGLPYDSGEVKNHFANAGTFLSWAFIVKADQPDPLVEQATPKGLYNLAALYWRYDRYAGAFGAADSGLNFLRKTGRADYRPEFHRIVAESHIRNRSYLEAVQELDTAIRQDHNPQQAAAAFARVGDIYFDLNNYDLAEDAYSLGAKIDEQYRQINPAQLVLRGESLFWLGRFSEAQKILYYALEGGTYRKEVQPLSDEYAAWASLRIADAFLARHELEKAKLEYYKVGHNYRSVLAGRIAKVREACLELPFYSGNNVHHARELLDEAKAGVEMPSVAQELGWACQVGSYTDRERTPEMLSRVRDFATTYPESNFLKTFAEPVRSYQASQIELFFKAGETYRALSFFETNRKVLFPKISPDLGEKLFVAYADIHKSEAASEFWQTYAATADSDLKVLRQAVVAGEMVSRKQPSRVWVDRDRSLQKKLAKRRWDLAPSALAVAYFDRMQNVATVADHLVWMAELAKQFGSIDNAYICDLEYPILSRIDAKGRERLAKGEALTQGALGAEKRLAEIISAEMPDLFRHDESCALSLLELEAQRLRRTPKALAELYIKRQSWPLVAGYLHLYWTIAEHVNDAGERGEARKLWEVIRDKGTPGSPETEFAKARLDPARTEFEKLWN